MATHFDLALGKGQLLPGGHHDLRFNNINACHPFSYRVLYLHTRVHFNEVELTVLIQKFKGSRATVADLFTGSDAALTHPFDKLARDTRCGRFLNDFLVPSLHRAITLAQIHCVFELVRHDLDFDMARVL